MFYVLTYGGFNFVGTAAGLALGLCPWDFCALNWVRCRTGKAGGEMIGVKAAMTLLSRHLLSTVLVYHPSSFELLK